VKPASISAKGRTGEHEVAAKRLAQEVLAFTAPDGGRS
jgi:hypothetical protein